MTDIQDRLLDCFLIVFPESETPITLDIRTDSLTEWDSMATVTLLGVIEEEFDISFEAEEIETLTSYKAIFDIVSDKVQNS